MGSHNSLTLHSLSRAHTRTHTRGRTRARTFDIETPTVRGGGFALGPCIGPAIPRRLRPFRIKVVRICFAGLRPTCPAPPGW